MSKDELKFYYVDSIDAYWIGQRLDNFYYAEWKDRLGFVWTHSRYLPWGEHIVEEDTLWKEHTYPSEPREIPFTEWIVGFMKKFISEDAISRRGLLEQIDRDSEGSPGYYGDTWQFINTIKSASSVIPKRSCYRCGLREDCEDSTEHESKKGGWIPCSERKPTKEGHYLCSFKEPQRIDNIYVGLAYWTGVRWYGYFANEINAWMPLPKPWEGTGDECLRPNT